MADAEIQVILELKDEMSKKLKEIEVSIKDLSNNTKKNTESLKNSFDKVQISMLNLGQVAQGIHNIFEISQNKTRILENATDRLENSQIRAKQSVQDLANAQQNLIDIEKRHTKDILTLERAQIRLEEATSAQRVAIMKYGSESLEARKATLDLKEAQIDLTDAQNLGKVKSDELSKAQQELRDRQDAVTIASNNVERAQRQLTKAVGDSKWAIVDMGVQAINVAGNLSTLIKNISGPGGLITSVTSLTGKIGITSGTALIGGATVIGALGLFGLIASQLKTDDLRKEIELATAKFNDLANSANDANAAIGRALQQEARLREVQRQAGVGGTRTDLAPSVQLSPEQRAGLVKPDFNVFIDNVYGMNPSDLSIALKRELATKISI